MHARGLRPRRARSMLAISHSSVLPSARWNGVGALISDLFHGSITLPACSPVNASRAALRLPAHDSGPGWLATPYLYDSCIRDFTPVYPGALQVPSKTHRFLLEFRELSRVRSTESSGFMERAMGIEPRPDSCYVSETMRYTYSCRPKPSIID